MNIYRRRIIQAIEQNARDRLAKLANLYPHAKPEEREAIMAGIEIERWHAETCRLSLE